MGILVCCVSKCVPVCAICALEGMEVRGEWSIRKTAIARPPDSYRGNKSKGQSIQSTNVDETERGDRALRILFFFFPLCNSFMLSLSGFFLFCLNQHRVGDEKKKVG